MSSPGDGIIRLDRKTLKEEAWPAFATAAHPGWEGRVFAVNTMDTGKITFADKRLAAATFTRTTIAQNAESMAAFIADVRNEAGSCHIEIVGHSMGGLISRQYIHEHMPELETDGRPLTDKLIMLGTPNQGSPCVEPAMGLFVHAQLAEMRNPPSDPADRLPFPPNNILELDRDVMGRFNDRVSNKKGSRSTCWPERPSRRPARSAIQEIFWWRSAARSPWTGPPLSIRKPHGTSTIST